MIIDAHTHLDDVMHTRLPVVKRLRMILEMMQANKVDRTFILADIPSDAEIKKGLKTDAYLSNEDTLALIKRYPQLHLVGKVPLKVCQNKAYLSRVRTHIEAREIIGIKLYPGYEPFYAHDKRYNKVYDMCEEHDIPVMIHTGDVMESGNLKYVAPLHVDEVAVKRPELKIILCHMGNPWQLDAAAVTFKNPNVYADTAGMFYTRLTTNTDTFLRKKIEEFVNWNEKGEKLIFGSDYPITSVTDTIALINELHFSKKEKHLIFCKNAKKLFGIK